MKEIEITRAVRNRYGSVARQGGSCCGSGDNKSSSCCGPAASAADISKSIGYSDADIASAPQGANLGLGCGNPLALASLKAGETVLDLGSGAGFDCFLAARQVGPKGRVIGVDMTPDMLDRARENAQKGEYANVEFRLGEIENLPVADASVDAIISNCVINLSNNKRRVFQEAFRVLKPGGRLMVSDMVVLKELPGFVKNSIDAYASCVAGAMLKDDYLQAVRQSGFIAVKVLDESTFPLDFIMNDPSILAVINDLKLTPSELIDIEDSVASVKVSGIKPA